jgi:YbbR domain-containing protein
VVKVKAHMVIRSPHSFRNHQSGPLKKFEKITQMTPQVHEVVIFGPYEDILKI